MTVAGEEQECWREQELYEKQECREQPVKDKGASKSRSYVRSDESSRRRAEVA